MLTNKVGRTAAAVDQEKAKRQLLPSFNEATDNHIHHCGVMNKYVAGVFLGVSDENVIGHNRIAESAAAKCWLWKKIVC